MCFVFPLNGRWSVYCRISSAAVCFTSFTVNGPFSNTLREVVPRAVTHKQYFACISELGLGDIIENVKNADFFFLFPVLTREINTSEQFGIKCICRKNNSCKSCCCSLQHSASLQCLHAKVAQCGDISMRTLQSTNQLKVLLRILGKPIQCEVINGDIWLKIEGKHTDVPLCVSVSLECA